MVTDDERDYMYAEYAKDPRMKLNLGSAVGSRRCSTAAATRSSSCTRSCSRSPGSPVLYYGDEIGMGDNVYLGDRDGVRTPMQWTGDRNGGFSRADFARLPAAADGPVFGYQAVNVEAQLRSPTSLLTLACRLIELRKEHPVFGLGDYTAVRTANPRIFAHIRRTRATSSCASTTSPGRPRRWSSISPGGRGKSRGDVRALAVPGDRRAALPAHARSPRLLLVPAHRAGGGVVTLADRVEALPATSCSP